MNQPQNKGPAALTGSGQDQTEPGQGGVVATAQGSTMPAASQAPFLQAALLYAQHGWPVIPICPVGSDGLCQCPTTHKHTGHDIGKAPARGIGLSHGHEEATTNETIICAWWNKLPEAGVGIDLARARLIDIAPDSPHWDEEFKRRGLPETLCFESGGGEGHRHYLYRRPDGVPEARITKPNEYDILSAGYSVLPPTRHSSGLHRTWIVGPADIESIPPAPEWAVNLLQRQIKPPVKLDPLALRWWFGEQFCTTPTGAVDRSATLQVIANALARKGADENTIINALAERDRTLGWNKFSDRADNGYTEYARSAMKALESNNQQPATSAAPGRPSNATLAVGMLLAENPELFHDPTGEAYVSLNVNSHIETVRIRSRLFQLMLCNRFYSEQARALSANACQEAINTIESIARTNGPELPVHVRIAEVENTVWIDLGTEDWRAVKITAAGWSVEPTAGVKFVRPDGLTALPIPEPGGSIWDLFQCVNAPAERAHQLLIIGWLTAALRGTGPYTVLAVMGEQGSAKTTAVRCCVELIDPGVARLRAEPRDPRDLMIAAKNSWCIAMDNISSLPRWLSDCLCRLSTGIGYPTRALYTDADEVLFKAKRPIVMNGITEFVSSPDLLNRALIVTLPTIPDSQRRLERDVMATFYQMRPRLLGALYDGVAASLANEQHIKLSSIPRMADFTILIAAAAPAYGLTGADIIEAYQTNRSEASALALEESAIVRALSRVAESNFTGTATELLEALNRHAESSEQDAPDWPKRPNRLTNILRRLAPNLRSIGIYVSFRPSRTRRLIIVSNTEEPTDSGQKQLGFSEPPIEPVVDVSD